VVAGVGLAVYFQTEKERMARKRIAEMSKGVGKPKVGGPLTGLVDQNKRERSEDEFLGKYRLVSASATIMAYGAGSLGAGARRVGV
jgi:protein SCO1/2